MYNIRKVHTNYQDEYISMASFIGYEDNVVIKFSVYYTSHIRIAAQIMDIIP